MQVSTNLQPRYAIFAFRRSYIVALTQGQINLPILGKKLDSIARLLNRIHVYFGIHPFHIGSPPQRSGKQFLMH